MQLYIDSYGASLTVQNKMWCVRVRDSDEERLFATSEVKVIFISKGVMLSSDALTLAIDNDVSVLLLDRIGHPVGQVWSGKFGSISTIRKKQTAWSIEIDALIWVKNNLIIPKVASQLRHLQLLPLRVKRAETVLEKIIAQLEAFIFDNFDKNPADSLRGYEGTASRHYFRALSQNLPIGMQFAARSTQPAEDAFNAALNYTYGFLYAQVEIALMKSGIDPAIGVLHIDRHNRPTFVYDFIEPYRVWADEVLMRLFCVETLHAAHFESLPDGEGVTIRAEARKIIATEFLAYTESMLHHKGLSRRRNVHIDLDAARLATHLKER